MNYKKLQPYFSHKNVMKPFLLALTISLLYNCSPSDSDSNDTNYFNNQPPSNQSNLSSVDYWLTASDKSQLFELHEHKLPKFSTNIHFSIQVDPETTYQEIDGFGFALTGGSALHLYNMDDVQRAELLTELFSPDGIGISYLRVSIGASDLDPDPFSYNDIPNGQTDVDLDQFTIERDQEYLIPVLKEILAINPEIKILGSPWSAPSWMKTNRNTIGGSLLTKYFSTYANYFVKYIEAYAAEGIRIDAITVQNEPLHDGNNPSMYMSSSDMTSFVKNNLGPTFADSKIDTKIIVWDHNADNTNYPITILNDPEANQYIDGSAFHLYAGDIKNLSLVHQAYPNKNLYFTEQWVGRDSDFALDLKWHTRELIIGSTRNWCKTVLEWNLVSNSQLDPHTDGGCTLCLGGLTIDGNNVTKNVGYYIIAHASKLVRPGSVRIQSNYNDELPNVAFKTPDNKIVVIVLNDTDTAKSFNILVPEEPVTASLSAGSVGTYVWDNK
jgi:glucosylceramidase